MTANIIDIIIRIIVIIANINVITAIIIAISERNLLLK